MSHFVPQCHWYAIIQHIESRHTSNVSHFGPPEYVYTVTQETWTERYIII
jgi:hypothetical protein